MKNIWRVARYEYRRNVFKKSFILLVVSVPIFITFSIGIGMTIDSAENNLMPVGYIDQANVFEQALSIPEAGPGSEINNDQIVAFIPYSSEEEATADLKEGVIQAFYVIPPDYSETRQVEQVFIEKPGKNAKWQFFDFLQINLLSSQPNEIAYRVAAGTDVTVRSIDGKRIVPSGGPTFALIMPLFFTMGFLFMILMSSGYTLSAVAEEKENRTMEVLITSTSPNHLIVGKIMGIVGISLTLLIIWALIILVGSLIGQRLGISLLADLSLDWGSLLSIFVVAIPAYTLAIALMTAIGAMVTTTQEGQTVSSIFFILHLVPLYIGISFLNHPNAPFAVFLSLSPFTALMTLGMRNLFTIIPAWQILVSMGVQILCALGAFWLAGRSLRLGMLRYGQRLTWRSLFRAAK